MNTIQQINILFWMNMIFTGIYVVLSIYWLGRKGISNVFYRRYRQDRQEEKLDELTHRIDSLIETIHVNEELNTTKKRGNKGS